MVMWTLITGANRGIGFELARQLLLVDRPVLIGGRSGDLIEKAKKELLQLTNKKEENVATFELDLMDDASITSAIEYLGKHYDQNITALVNNAAILRQDTWTRENFDEVLKTNYHGTLRFLRGVAPLLPPESRVVNISSRMGELSGLPQVYREAIANATLDDLEKISFDPNLRSAGTVSYSVSKAMINRATHLLAEEEPFKKRHIKLVAQTPGWVQTRMGGSGAPKSIEDGGRAPFRAVTCDFASLPNGCFVDEEVKPLEF